MTQYNYYVEDSILIFKSYVMESIKRLNKINSQLEKLYKKYNVASLNKLIGKIICYNDTAFKNHLAGVGEDWKLSNQNLSMIADIFDIDSFCDATSGICEFIADIKLESIKIIDSHMLDESYKTLGKVYFNLGSILVTISDLESLVSRSRRLLDYYKNENNLYISSVNDLIQNYSDILAELCIKYKGFFMEFLREHADKEEDN